MTFFCRYYEGVIESFDRAKKKHKVSLVFLIKKRDIYFVICIMCAVCSIFSSSFGVDGLVTCLFFLMRK